MTTKFPLTLNPKEAQSAFSPTNILARSPRASPAEAQPPKEGGSPSTVEYVLQQKEARRLQEEEEHKRRLHAARVDYFETRKRLFTGVKGEYLDTDLVLEWSAGAFVYDKSFVHRGNRLSSELSAREHNVALGDSTEETPDVAMSLDELEQQWAEATWLLRAPLDTSEQLERARVSVRASLHFLESLSELATQHEGALAGGTGAIFQQLLADLAECGLSGVMVDNMDVRGGEGGRPTFEQIALTSEMADRLGARAQWAQMLAAAHETRRIVRIKLQDANDLKAAQYALECCSTVFQELAAHAEQRSCTLFAVVELLNSAGVETSRG
mmetsp:Transcript_8666/g.22413  ORF Transcript_8666/g.22413 Transcript_8666/m.22413 type:complete len:326 (-) Transcript_8666:260-1237(-)